MKKLIVSFILLIGFFGGMAQTIPAFPSGLQVQNLGGPTNMVYTRNIHGAAAGFAYYGAFDDTTSANLNAFYKNIAGMTIRTGNTLWIRDSTKQYWIEFGAGSLNIDTSATILLRGDGSPPNPLIGDLRLSANAGNILQVFPDGAYATTQTQIQNGLISGGLVIWQNGLSYIVTAATYAIGGVIYNSPETQITLDNADPSLNRIDGFVVTTSGTATDLTGTPSTDPVNPSYNPATQLPLTFVLVTAASTEPTFCRDSIYFPNNGNTWTATVSNPGRINVTSTNNPYSVTQDVEFTLAQNGDQLRLTKGTAITTSTYSVMVLKLRSKAVWASTSRITLQFYNVLTPLGVPVVVGDNTPYGFNSSNAATYQTVAIPLGNFGSTTGATNVLLQVVTTGGNTIGFYLDDWELLGCNGTPPVISGSFWNTSGTNQQGTTLYGGTADNFPVQFRVNNTNHTLLNTNGTAVMQGASPGVSLQLNSFGSADYFWQRVGTSMIHNTAGDYLLRVAGNSMYFVGAANGHIWNSSAGVNQMRLAGTGALRLYNYGDNTFTGTATRWLAVDVDGNVIEQAPPISTPSANNGLSISGSNVQLGGNPLVQNSAISTSAFNLSIESTNAISTFTATNTDAGGGGSAITAEITGFGSAVYGTSTASGGGYGGTFLSDIGIGLQGSSTSNFGAQAITGSSSFAPFQSVSNTSVTNAVVPLGEFRMATSGTGANGIGGYIDFRVETDANQQPISNQIISKWTTAANASRTSEFSITGVNSATTVTLMTIAGTGTMTLGAAYQGLGAGYLAVSNGGVVTWSAGGGGGGGDALTANPLSQFAPTTSAQLAGVISDEVGTAGFLVFSVSPTLTTPNLGTPSAVTLTNATGLPIATGISGLGTGVATALAINTGSTGAFVLFNGALGTPTSGTVSTGVTLGDVTMNVTGTDATGDVYYRSAGGLLTRLPIGTSGQIIRTSAGGIPEWFTSGGGTGTMTSATLTQPAAGITITNSGVAQTTVATWTVALSGDLAGIEALATTGPVKRSATNTWITAAIALGGSEVSGTLLAANGGTGFASGYTAGQILWASNATTLTRGFLNGTTNQINVASSAGGVTVSHAFNPTEQTLTSGATINWNVTNGANAVLTLNNTGATLTLANMISGYTYTLRLIQGSGGSRTITTWTNVQWQGGVQPTLSTTVGATDIISLYYSSNTNRFYGTIATNMN